MTNIDISQANSVYNLSVCASYSLPSGNNNLINESAPVNVYMRQRTYPYKKLTTVEGLFVVSSTASSGSKGCQEVSLKTLNQAIVTDLKG